MSTWFRLALVLCLGSASALPPFVPTKALSRLPLEVNYWQNRELARQMREDRTILVSVQTSKDAGDKVQLTLRGAGLINVPLDETYQRATDLSHVKQWSSYITEAKYDQARGQLAIHIAILFHSAEMLVQFQKDSENAPVRYLLWDVLAGSFKGLRGQFEFRADDPTHTRISVMGRYHTKHLPLPRTLAALIFEAILQKFAESVRNHVENMTNKTSGVEPQKSMTAALGLATLASDVYLPPFCSVL